MQEYKMKYEKTSVSDENGVKILIFSDFFLICLQKGRYLQRFLGWNLEVFRYLCSRL